MVFYNFLINGAIASTIILITGYSAYVSYQSIVNNTPKNVTTILENNGFKNIKIGRFSLLCPKGTPINRKFKAINKDENEVEGRICKGNLFSITNNIHITKSKPKI